MADHRGEKCANCRKRLITTLDTLVCSTCRARRELVQKGLYTPKNPDQPLPPAKVKQLQIALGLLPPDPEPALEDTDPEDPLLAAGEMILSAVPFTTKGSYTVRRERDNIPSPACPRCGSKIGHCDARCWRCGWTKGENDGCR